MSARFHVILADRIDNTQRTQIHHIVKANAEEWWHAFLDSWIVRGGGTEADWRNRFAPIVPEPPAQILVLRLPEKKQRGWAVRSPGGRANAEWLRNQYTHYKPEVETLTGLVEQIVSFRNPRDEEETAFE